MNKKNLSIRSQVIEILSVLSLVATMGCIYLEGFTMASFIILSLEIPCVILLFIDHRLKVKELKLSKSIMPVVQINKMEEICLQKSQKIDILDKFVENKQEVQVETPIEIKESLIV